MPIASSRGEGDGERVEFSLIESLLWEPGAGFFLLDRHLRRLEGAARRFGFPIELDRVLAELNGTAARCAEAAKVRLMAKPDGRTEVEASPLSGFVRLRAGIATSPVDSSDELLRYKTSRREVYDRARRESPGLDEVLLWNERGELTETCTGNLVLEIAGRMWTPAAHSGLLPGTFREHLLETGGVEERVLPVESLRQASRVFHVNSVRRWVEIELVGEDGGARLG